jgi:hypothetical protein
LASASVAVLVCPTHSKPGFGVEWCGEPGATDDDRLDFRIAADSNWDLSGLARWSDAQPIMISPAWAGVCGLSG